MDGTELDATEPPQYNVGAKLVTTGEEVIHIFGQTDHAGVFLVKGHKIQIRWEFYASTVLPQSAYWATSKYEALYYAISASTGEKDRRRFIYQIANSLFSALHQTDISGVDHCFEDVEQTVYHQAKANMAYRYLIGASAATAGALIVAAVLARFIGVHTDADPFLLAVSAGGIGAFLSVLQRIGALPISRFAPLWWAAALEGAVRVVLGVLFGVFFVLANKADLVLGTFSGNLYAIAAFSALSGISERFVPEIIRRLESGEAPPAELKTSKPAT